MNIEDQLERFREEKFSHLSAEEHLASVNDSIEKYRQIHISFAYQEKTPSRKFLQNAELFLAEEALKKGCLYVTNLDYVQYRHTVRNGQVIIVGRGLIKK